MSLSRKQRFLLIGAFLVTSAVSCLFGWRMMPRIWQWTKGLFVAPVSVPKEPYIPAATASLQETFSQDDSVVYYFYKDNCPYCKEIDGLFTGLPAEILLQNGQTSRVRLVCVNKNEQLDMCNAYYEKAGIPENRRFVPAVSVGSQYLFTPSEILEGLYAALLQGEGLNTPMMGDNLRE